MGRGRGPQRAGGLGLDLAAVQPTRTVEAERGPPSKDKGLELRPGMEGVATVSGASSRKGRPGIVWAWWGTSIVVRLHFRSLGWARVHAGVSTRLNRRLHPAQAPSQAWPHHPAS